jgi:hypothetical protein
MTALYVICNERPDAVFSLEFLFHPPPGFIVDLDRIDVGTPVIPDDQFWDPPDPGDHSYWAGVLVTQHEPHRVWRLNGEATATGGLLARWPD